MIDGKIEGELHHAVKTTNRESTSELVVIAAVEAIGREEVAPIRGRELTKLNLEISNWEQISRDGEDYVSPTFKGLDNEGFSKAGIIVGDFTQSDMESESVGIMLDRDEKCKNGKRGWKRRARVRVVDRGSSAMMGGKRRFEEKGLVSLEG